MTARQEVHALIAKYGAEFDEWGSRGEFRASVWSPPGVKFVATDCHVISVSFHSDRPAGWQALLDDLKRGVADCDWAECETCEEVRR